MIAVVDYGVGNLFSLCSSLRAIGAETVITAEKAQIRRADKIILPGVGAFGDAAEKLHSMGLDELLKEEAASGKEILGICLGMQLLFDSSEEYGFHKGLGLLQGHIAAMQGRLPAELKIPHIGWNALCFHREHRLLHGLREGDCVYFVHSFYADGCEDSLIASAEYGLAIPAIVGKDNVMGCQFHPEKSGKIGLRILRNFCEVAQ